MKLEKSTYKPFGLEAIEIASRDEIAELQALNGSNHVRECL